MKYLVVFFVLVGFVGTVFAVPELDHERSYERADYVFYGEVLSAKVLSESIQTHDKNHYSETPGKVVYSLKVHDFIKNSFENKVISAHGEYLEKPHGMSYTPNLYKIGDKLVFYVHISDDLESSYSYLIDYAASHYIPTECKYYLPANHADLIYDVHSCSWKRFIPENNDDASMCGTGTELVDGVCQIIGMEKTDVVGDDASFFGIFVYIDNLISWIFGK
ncbi:hypothetical protein [Nitrosopumilus piranensis]|uniref:Uncharacterized protein n=1 Tax=Nitrosopumilus piranensis TaxID=1582439 RepID=A0A0C5BTP1_9ARCH|nr:hypothetical protein [Nitrosopumilus piranensis]AJM93103.1 conserved exported protein of unknown function [Nitrosopumilus piranensis]